MNLVRTGHMLPLAVIIKVLSMLAVKEVLAVCRSHARIVLGRPKIQHRTEAFTYIKDE
jgi:hypothetical protein